MTRLALSNVALFSAVRAVTGMTPRLLVLGGGGYNPWAVGRCWAGIWATLNRLPLPDALPPAARELMQAVRWRHRLGARPPERWLTTLADDVARKGDVREEVRALAAIALCP